MGGIKSSQTCWKTSRVASVFLHSQEAVGILKSRVRAWFWPQGAWVSEDMVVELGYWRVCECRGEESRNSSCGQLHESPLSR